MSKDVIVDKYARLYEIPNQLALLGHQVECFCLSYQSHQEGLWDDSNAAKQLVWHSKSYLGIQKFSILSYPLHLLKQLEKFQPDIIIAASDIPHIVLGAWCANKLGKPFVADLYDNFEGFGQARIPGMKSLLRHAVCQAQIVTATSQPLADLVTNQYKAKGKVFSMPSTVSTQIFFKRNKDEAREQLGLPKDKLLVGTAGGLYRDKGVEIIYNAWKVLEKEFPNVHLVLAGPYQEDVPPPSGERVHYLGSLPHEDIAALFQALDVGIISILDTPFGRYCFPQKAYEMLACNLPIVAANIGAMHDLLSDYPECLFNAADKNDLADKIQVQLNKPVHPNVPIDDWAKIVGRLELELKKLIS